jgi:anti-sigma factor RsiW
MNCHSVRHVLDLRAEGRLPPGRAARVDAHLSSCAACRALAAPAAVPSAPSPALPAEFKSRLLAAARAAKPASAPKEGRSLALWPSEAPAVALAAAALALVGLLIAASGVPSQSTGGTLSAAVEEP